MCKKYECLYYAPSTGSCDFFLITGRRRPCPATDDCECFCTEESKMERLNKHLLVRVINFKGIEAMERLYRPELDSPALSKLAGVSQQEALAWIRKVHPENKWLQNARPRFYARGVEG